MTPHTLAPIARQSKSELSPFAAQCPLSPLTQRLFRLPANSTRTPLFRTTGKPMPSSCLHSRSWVR